MNFKMKILIISLIAFASFGCADKKEKQKTETTQKVESHEGHDHSSQEIQKAETKLNSGKKWKVDEHTRNSMKKISQITNSSYVKTPKEFNELGLMLKNEMKNLIAECTMQGEPHNQLHNYLTTLIPHIDELVEAKTQEEGEKYLQEVKTAVDAFYKTFE